MARSRGFPARSRFPRRKTAWAVGPEANGVSIAATLTPILWSSGVALSGGQEQATITRIRGYTRWTLTAVTVARGGFRLAVGFGIVSAEAFAAGVASVPSPIGDLDWDGWMFHQFADLHSVTATIADGVNAVGCSIYQEIDVKSQRILESDNVLVAVAEAENEVGAAAAVLDADSRILIKLA